MNTPLRDRIEAQKQKPQPVARWIELARQRETGLARDMSNRLIAR